MTDILKTAPDVKILATSRVRLNVGGEHRFQVGGMEYPPLAAQTTLVPGVLADTALRRAQDVAQYSAVKLFLQGARRAQPGFALMDENLSGIVQICRLVEGMPLGIRLAAAWVEILTPAEIAEEIERGLDFLETEVRDVPERQRSIRAAFDHSWQLLTEREKTIYQALSVFRGGFTRQAAAEVTGASVRELKALADKSFLSRVATGRYEIHELLRQYAAEKLDQGPSIAGVARDRHSAYYCTFLQQRESDLKGARQQAAMAEIGEELKNARLAWNWAVAQGQIERLTQAIESLGIFYKWRGRYQEGEAAFRVVAGRLVGPETGGEYRCLARVLAWQGHFSHLLGRSEHVDQLLQQSLSLLDSPEASDQDIRAEKAFVLRVMGGKELAADSYEEARRLCEQSLALYRALGDCWGTAVTLASLCETANDFDQAKQLVDESLAIRRTLGDQRGISDSLSILGHIATERGQLEEGERLHRESLALCRELGDQPAVALCLLRLNFLLTQSGKYAEARLALEEMLQIYDNLGDRGGVAQAYQALGYAEIMLGRYRQGRTLIEAARPIFREFGWSLWLGYYFGDLGKVALAEQAYTEARQLLQEGLAIFREIGDSGSIAESLDGLAYVECRLGNTPRAQRYLSEALGIAIEGGSVLPLWEALPAVALLLADRGEPERAVELYALAWRYPHVANSRWFEDVAGRHIAAVAATLPPEVVTAAQERGKARDVWATAEELLVELEG